VGLPAVTNNEAESRFELTQDGATAVLLYRLRRDTLILVHTEVPPEIRRRGIGTELTRVALSYARQSQLIVVPLCPFVSDYIRRHPEELDIVREDHREKLSHGDS